MFAAIGSGVTTLGATFLFGFQSILAFLRHGVSFRQVVAQIYSVGVRSLPTTLLTGAFVGAILAIQLDMQLRDFGAQGFLGGLSASVTIRNVGPVLIAFILSGKVGAFTSAELATMQVTDQVNALRCLGADPIRYLVVPRLVGVVLASFLLLIVGLMVALGGGALIASLSLGINGVSFVRGIPAMVTWWSVAMGVAKSFIFGSLIAFVSCYQGYNARGGSVGVGKAVQNTSVQTLILIILADFAISSFATSLGELWESLA